ncbi:MAG: GGDEF domain-containing protein [Afipia sp.]|nr:GGDEF domain-containing protein [Afipia sp.]OUX60319.1 MAG: GGDEF domain-containing protein [Afipia sp. TMED4]HAO39480.1 GGDEF domain-containing protein [Afipia sp.]HAQ92209.1 GGDEF domain-containing protein [Afipia sp.]
MTPRSISYLRAALQRVKLQLMRCLPCGGDYSLRRKLLIGTGLALICTAILAISVIGQSLDDYRHARQNLRGLESFRLILDTANLLSAERGPSNSVLGATAAEHGALRERLTAFRARSDAILDQLSTNAGVPAELLAPTKAQLQKGRQEVDRVAAIPRERRGLQDVQSVIESMFDVVDIFQSVIVWKAGDLTAQNPELAAPVMIGRIFGELREFGGRIASQIMAPIAVSQPLQLKHLVDSNRTRGRILELWRLAGNQKVIGIHDPRLASDLGDIELMFFGEGLGILDGLIAEGRKSGNYSMTADEFTVRFVNTLKPLERLRGDFLDVTIERLTALRNGALATLVVTIAITTVILAIMVGLLIAAQRFVFGPLMRAREAVIVLAEDRPTVPYPEPHHDATEMRRLFDAIAILRDSLAERASLTKKLKQQAETDGLTGLMNRRALDMIGESHTSSQVMADGACLILMDIDHFKSINDRYGHLEGDHVLKETVRRVRPMLGQNDIFARFGGEEFVILIPGHDLSEANALAKRIRAALETNEIVLSSGAVLTVTASFGVARGNLGQFAWRRLVEAADAALYRAKSDGRNCVRHSLMPQPTLVPDLPDDGDLNAPREIPPQVLTIVGAALAAKRSS